MGVQAKSHSSLSALVLAKSRVCVRVQGNCSRVRPHKQADSLPPPCRVRGMEVGEGGQDCSPGAGEVRCSTVSSSVSAGLDLGPCQEPLVTGRGGVLLCNSKARGSSLGGSVILSWHRNAACASLQEPCFPE